MAAENDQSRVSPAYRLIHHYRERAAAAVQRYDEAIVRGTVPQSVRRDLATAALDYFHILHEHRDEEALEEPWDERGIEFLEELQGETVTVEQSLPRANGATTYVERPAILAVDPRRLTRAILELNDIAKELGLSAEVRESTNRAEITDEMLEWVEEWRQANQE